MSLHGLDQYAPPGESDYDLWRERLNLDGSSLGTFAYGVLFCITVDTVRLFVLHPRQGDIRWVAVAYCLTVFTLATIGIGTSIKFIEMTYINYRNYPGGPNAFTSDYYANWINMLGFACYTIMPWFADALMLFRYITIWHFSYGMAIFPVLLYLGSICSGLGLVVSITRPNSSVWTKTSIHFGTAYWSFSIALNVLLTVLIAWRLWRHQRECRQYLGDSTANIHLSIVAMLIESAALYSTWGFTALVLYALNHPLQRLVLVPFAQVQGIAPLLIMARVARGIAWTESTTAQLSVSQPMEFHCSAILPNTVQTRPEYDVSTTSASGTANESGLNAAKEYKEGVMNDVSPD